MEEYSGSKNTKNDFPADLFSRQVILKDWGELSQEKLRRASVLVIGVGGLGCPVALYLAAGGIGNITIADGDTIASHNLHRQILFGINDIGRPKAEVAANKVGEAYPFCKVTFIPENITERQADALFSEFDIIIDATDNFQSRYIISKCCRASNRPHVFGAVSGWQGQVAIWNFPQVLDPPIFYHDAFPKRPKEGMIENCEVAGVMGVAAGLTATLMASECMKMIASPSQVVQGQLLQIDALSNEFYKVDFKGVPRVTNLDSGLSLREWSPHDLKKRIDSGKPIQLIDVREEFERMEFHIGGTHIPLGDIPLRFKEIDTTAETVVYCQHGIRSEQALNWMLQHGHYNGLYHLKGGVAAWIDTFGFSSPQIGAHGE